MSRYDDYRSSSGTLDSRDRYDRYSRGPPVAERERPRRVDEERFELRLSEEDRYGPPARAVGRYYEDDYLSQPSEPPVTPDRRRRRAGSSAVAPPRLIRRQSSLDTFDRIPRRKLESLELRDRAGPLPHAPPPPRLHVPSPGRYREREVYEDIRIAEPDYYGDEEFRDIRGRDTMDRRSRRSSSAARRRHEEKPYPRKGKTRIPRKWVHVHAIMDLGYPYKEEDETIVIQKALSKEQIDEVISISREYRRPANVETEYLRLRSPPRERVTTEQLVVDSRQSPRSSHDMFIVEPSRSPSRYREVDYRDVDYRDVDYRDVDYRDVEYRDVEYEEVERPVRSLARPRSISVVRPRSVSIHSHRPSSPLRVLESRTHVESRPHEGSMVLVRPKRSDHDISAEIVDLENERRILRAEPHGGIEITRQKDTDIIDSRGNEEEIIDIRRQERSEPRSRVMRAMFATLT
ncbi:hypothetical protein N7470_001243 [Penicillium chermesinum]|nr:hypothetical protein N7470_001243 [Penicillium chermesinum]